MDAESHRALIERYLGAYNAFDVPGMLAVLHPAIEFRNVTNGEITAAADGLASFRELAERAAAMFESRRQTLARYVATADGASIEVDYDGVLAADLSPALRAGDTLRLSGRSTFAIRDGRIAHIVDES